LVSLIAHQDRPRQANDRPDEAGAPAGRIASRESIAWLILVGIAFALRIHALTRQSLWPDEVYNVVAARWPLAETWTRLVGDHVPLYTVLLGGWEAVAGDSELALRFLSVIAGMLIVALGAVLARRLLGPAAGFVAAALLVISPFQLYYAQEVVTYSLLGVLALASSWVFLRWMDDPPWRVVILQGALYAALAYTHYVGVFVPATHAAIALASHCIRGAAPAAFGPRSPSPAASPRWLVAPVLGALLFLPWPVTHVAALAGNVVGGASRSPAQLAAATLVDLGFGNAIQAHLDAGNPIDAIVLRDLTVAALPLAVFLLLGLVPRRKAGALLVPRGTIVAFLHVVVPYALIIALSESTRGFDSRYGFPASPWFPIAAVAGLWRLRPPLRWAGIALLAAYSAWGALIYFDNPGFARIDFRTSVNDVVDQHQPEDSVVVTAPYVASTVDYYGNQRGLQLSPVGLPAVIPQDAARTRATLASLAERSDRIWLLSWQDYYSDPHGVINGWLADNAFRANHRDLGNGLRVDLWLTRPPLAPTLPPGTTPVNGRIGDDARLLGYQAMRPDGESVALTFFWKLDAPMTDDYTVFLHLASRSGEPVAQTDSRPWDGQFPTNRWPVGPIIRDLQVLHLDPCAVPGDDQLTLGFYALKTMQRLGPPGRDSLSVPLTLGLPPPAESDGWLLRRLPAALRLDHHLAGYSGVGCQ
jgi:4-amino-4-deoxy-L-arabinose transferase-like glycosyltransferase